MREIKKKSIIPIYAVGGTWLLYCLFFPLYRLWHFLLAAAITACVYAVSKKLFPTKIEQVEAPPEPEPQPQTDPEIEAIIREGDLALSEMERLRASIKNAAVRERVAEIMDVSRKIIDDAAHDKKDIPQIRQFLDYYLPTTIKLLNAYDRMYVQDLSDEGNVGSSMQRIEDMLATIVRAYKKQLDALFADEALDVETEIEVMDNMLAREGLKDSDFEQFNRGQAKGQN